MPSISQMEARREALLKELGKGITGRQMDDLHMSDKNNHAWGNGIGCVIMKRQLTFIEKVYEIISWFLAIMLVYLLFVCCCCSRDDDDSPAVIVVNPDGYQMPPMQPASPHVEVQAVRHFSSAVPPTIPVVPACEIHPEQMLSAFHAGPAEHLDVVVQIPQDAPVPLALAEEPDMLAELYLDDEESDEAPAPRDQAWIVPEEPTEEASRDSPSVSIEEEPEFNVECHDQVIAI